MATEIYTPPQRRGSTKIYSLPTDTTGSTVYEDPTDVVFVGDMQLVSAPPTVTVT
jgi:hypothetical protein